MASRHLLNILAVCTGNICRSPIAEGILRKSLPDNISTASAGTHALVGNPATEFAVIASLEKGIDISMHRAQALTGELIRGSGVILCMEISHIEWVLSRDDSAQSRIFNLANFRSGRKGQKAIADPYGCSLREFRECFNDLEDCIKNFIEDNNVL